MLDYDELRRSSAMAEERDETLATSPKSRGGLRSLTAFQRLVLALLLFLNVLVLGCLCLVATGRIIWPF
jgi:hypothetical protein